MPAGSDPQPVDQTVARNDLTAAQDQVRQQGPLPWATERDRPLLLEHLDRPQDPEFEHRRVAA